MPLSIHSRRPSPPAPLALTTQGRQTHLSAGPQLRKRCFQPRRAKRYLLKSTKLSAGAGTSLPSGIPRIPCAGEAAAFLTNFRPLGPNILTIRITNNRIFHVWFGPISCCRESLVSMCPQDSWWDQVRLNCNMSHTFKSAYLLCFYYRNI